MRIAYGVMGYGRGHSTRARAVLPALQREHEVTVFAGGDAHDMLAGDLSTVRIPTLGYVYGRNGHASLGGTMKANAGPVSALLFGGESSREVEREFRARGIELVISDSEAWTHRAARRLRLPRISFDHVGVIAWCRAHFPPELWWRGQRDALVYRSLIGTPDRALISSFYGAEALLPSTRLVGPILRREVAEAVPSTGEFLLAYFNRGQTQFTPAVERALIDLDMPVIVYGTPRRGARENLRFRAIDPLGFVRDLATCRAVIATAGNQLIGEALHLRKPFLALPERVFEQQLNAWMVERMRIGRAADLATLTAADVELFLVDAEVCSQHMGDYARDGTQDAIAALHEFIDQLRRPSRVAVAGALTGEPGPGN